MRLGITNNSKAYIKYDDNMALRYSSWHRHNGAYVLNTPNLEAMLISYNVSSKQIVVNCEINKCTKQNLIINATLQLSPLSVALFVFSSIQPLQHISAYILVILLKPVIHGV